jgi:SAM-dependent methyltransferase
VASTTVYVRRWLQMTSFSSLTTPQTAGRATPSVDERVRRALAWIDTAGLGLEIGPSYNPLLPKRSGARVEIVDHGSREELVAKYRGYGLPADKLDQIEEVDYVSRGGSLLDVIGRTSAYDFILASNVIEHSVDLIGFLQECQALLKPQGRLSLIVPDQRFCFDLFKPLTSIGHVVDAHLYPTQFHTPGSLLEHTAYACTRSGAIAWGQDDAGPVELQFTDLSSGQEQIHQGLGQAEYYDTHRWKFTPSSFSLLIQDLGELGYHALAEIDSAPTLGFEFFVTLGRPDPRPTLRDRLELLQQTRRELAAVAALDGVAPSDAELARALTAARIELEQMRSSRSWRITRPLRRIAGALRRR